MAKVTKTCRVCGKQYEACHTPNTTGVFRWRDVACSIECGRIYLERIEASRKPAVQVNEAVEIPEPAEISVAQAESDSQEENSTEAQTTDLEEDVEIFKKKKSAKKATPL